ncbi:MAG: hypothetical protein ACRBBP_07245 [Bdellovibrionales bacterium]
MKNILIIAATAFISINSLYAHESSPAHPPTPNQPEILMGFLSSDHGITFQTASCGGKEIFEVSIMESFPLQLQLLRRSDMSECSQVYTHGQSIFFSYRELGIGGGAFTISNEIIPGPLR